MIKPYLPLFIILSLLVLQSCMNRSQNKTGDTSESTDERPNIIVVLVDDLRWDEYGEGGHNYLITPNIDRISKEGINFKNAFSTTPLCSPSRASFLTGMYAHSNGITDNLARNEQSHQLVTFPGLLNDAGYETAFMGKWHMGNDNTRRPGFEEWIALKGQGEPINPVLNVNGKEQIVEGYITDILTEYSLQFINKKRSAPFLLYLSHKALHPYIMQMDDGTPIEIDGGGFIAAERHKGMYSDKVFNRRPNSGIVPVDKPALMRQIGDLPPLGPKTITSEKIIRERAEMLMAVDDGLGEMLDALKKNGKLDNTIVVLTSDHGYWYGEHGLDFERRLAYEEAIRIPLLIRYPKSIKAHTSADHMVLSIDLAPTLLELAGQKHDESLQGRSLVPIFNNSVTEWRNSFLIEYYSDHVFERMDHMGYKAVRTERYKYIHYLDIKGADELYDLDQDPYEMGNMINDPKAETIISDMKELLNEQLVKTDSEPISDM